MSDQRVALVTAGGSGIGRCISESLVTQGWAVFICDIDPAAVSDVCEIDGIEGSVIDVSALTRSLHSLARSEGNTSDLTCSSTMLVSPDPPPLLRISTLPIGKTRSTRICPVRSTSLARRFLCSSSKSSVPLSTLRVPPLCSAIHSARHTPPPSGQ